MVYQIKRIDEDVLTRTQITTLRLGGNARFQRHSIGDSTLQEYQSRLARAVAKRMNRTHHSKKDDASSAASTVKARGDRNTRSRSPNVRRSRPASSRSPTRSSTAPRVSSRSRMVQFDTSHGSISTSGHSSSPSMDYSRSRGYDVRHKQQQRTSRPVGPRQKTPARNSPVPQAQRGSQSIEPRSRRNAPPRPPGHQQHDFVRSSRQTPQGKVDSDQRLPLPRDSGHRSTGKSSSRPSIASKTSTHGVLPSVPLSPSKATRSRGQQQQRHLESPRTTHPKLHRGGDSVLSSPGGANLQNAMRDLFSPTSTASTEAASSLGSSTHTETETRRPERASYLAGDDNISTNNKKMAMDDFDELRKIVCLPLADDDEPQALGSRRARSTVPQVHHRSRQHHHFSSPMANYSAVTTTPIKKKMPVLNLHEFQPIYLNREEVEDDESTPSENNSTPPEPKNKRTMLKEKASMALMHAIRMAPLARKDKA